MRVPFSEAPSENTARPIVEVAFPDAPQLTALALVDSGARGNRFSADIADVLGLDLSRAKPEQAIVGGGKHRAYPVDVTMQVGSWSWSAPVWFVKDWPHAYGLLGLDGFFDSFNVSFVAARSEFRIIKHRRG